MQHKEAFSLLDLENELDTVDKSTIYRTITLFFSPSFGFMALMTAQDR